MGAQMRLFHSFVNTAHGAVRGISSHDILDLCSRQSEQPL